MDIKKDIIIKKSNLANKLLIPSSILIIFVFTLFWYQSTRMPTSETVNRNDITIGKVKKGKLNISIKGFGKLISNKQVLHTSLVEATVARPSALVTTKWLCACCEMRIRGLCCARGTLTVRHQGARGPICAHPTARRLRAPLALIAVQEMIVCTLGTGWHTRVPAPCWQAHQNNWEYRVKPGIACYSTSATVRPAA